MEPRITPAVRRELQSAELSFTAQLAQRVLPVLATAALRASGLDALVPLIHSDIVKNVIAAALEAKRKQPEPPMSKLWAAKSMAITLKKDELRKLPSEVVGIL